MRSGVICPQIAQVTTWFTVLECHQEQDCQDRRSPLEDQFHRDSEQLAVNKAPRKKGDRRNQKNNDQVLVFETQERDTRSQVAVNGRGVEAHWIPFTPV